MRRWWIALIAVIVLLIGGVVAGFFGLNYVREQRAKAALVTARAEAQKQNWPAAKRFYREYLFRFPQDTESLREYAHVALASDGNRMANLQTATSAYNQIVERQPEDEAALKTLIDLQIQRRSWADLEYYSGRLLERHPENAYLKYQHAYALDEMGDWQAAQEEYEALIESGRAAEYPEVYERLARLLVDQGLRSTADEVIATALEAHPENAGVLAAAGRYKVQRGVAAEGNAHIEKALELAPEDPHVLNAAAEVARSQGDFAAAEEYAERLVAVDPDNRPGLLGLLSALQQQNKYDEAVQALANVDDHIKADHPELFVSEAELYLTKGEIEKAKEVRELYARYHPDHRPVLQYLEARFLLEEGNATDAIARLLPVIDNSPDFRQPRFYLITAYLRAGDRDQARNALQAYMELYPADSAAQSLYNQQFAIDQPAETLQARAETLLTDTGASYAETVNVAQTLFNKTWQEFPDPTAHEREIALLEKAIASEPDRPEAYAVLMELAAVMEQPERAQAVLERAQARQIESHQLRIAEASVAVSADNPEAAKAVFESALEHTEMSMDEAASWSRFFARHTGLADGLQALEKFKSESTTQGISVTAAQAALALDYGEVEQATAFVDTLTAQATSDTDRELMVDAKVRLIETLLAEGPNQDLKHAEAIAADLASANPNSPRVRLLQAQIMLTQDPPNEDDAAQIIDELLQQRPDDANVLLAAASLAQATGNVQQALAYADAAAAQSPESSVAARKQAELLMSMGRTQQAQVVLERLYGETPHDASVIRALMEAYRANEQFARARAMVQQLREDLAAHPELAATVELVAARLNIQEGRDLPEAVEDLQSHLEANPTDLRTRLDLAVALAAQGKEKEGRALLESYAEANLGDPAPWVVLAQYMVMTGEAGEAQTALTQARLIDKNFYPAMSQELQLFMMRGQAAPALALTERMLELQPYDTQVLHQRALLLAQDPRRRQEADALLDELIAADPRPDYLLLRAQLNLAEERYDAALTDLLEVGRVQSETTAAADAAMAEAYLGLQDYERAQSYLEQARNKAQNANVSLPQLERLEAAIREATAAGETAAVNEGGA